MKSTDDLSVKAEETGQLTLVWLSLMLFNGKAAKDKTLQLQHKDCIIFFEQYRIAVSAFQNLFLYLRRKCK